MGETRVILDVFRQVINVSHFVRGQTNIRNDNDIRINIVDVR